MKDSSPSRCGHVGAARRLGYRLAGAAALRHAAVVRGRGGVKDGVDRLDGLDHPVPVHTVGMSTASGPAPSSNTRRHPPMPTRR